MGNFHYRRQHNSTSLQRYNGALRFLNTDLNPILISFDENQRLILNDRLYDKAIPPLKILMQIQKGNSNATVDKEKVTEMIQICETKLAHYEKSEKEIYQRMFRPKTTTSLPSNQQRQTKTANQIDNKNASWWPYVALGSAVLATVALVTFIKHRNIS
ncbi:unnamed protein product [Rotaria socialis]|uniref:Uncharacterized protein n=2 Tax=Rotaria socialis TaxID=392032 RepID=A0A821NQL6_9BILA|nr:unnamed protein product [Rotaria socialis]